jgi:Glycosyl hydrolase family 12
VRRIISGNRPDDDLMHGSGRHRRGVFPRSLPLSRTGLIGAITGAVVLAAGGATAVTFMTAGNGSGARPAAIALSPGTVTGGHAAADGASVTRLPSLAASPHVAVMPKPTAHTSRKPRPSASHPAPSGSAAVPSANPSSPPVSAAPPPPVAAGSASCTHPSFVTSAPTGIWGNGGYYVYNNMWNVSGYNVSETLYACSYSNWYVTATMNNDSGDGAVKTYPNVQMNFNEPQISSLHSVTSTYAQTSPQTGIYEDAYDIWLNGVASSGSTEVMVWTQNYHQVPAGSQEATATLGGHSYTVYRTSSGGYIAFVADQNSSSGTVDLLAIFNWLIAKGWIPADSTLGQICYGVELVSTNGVPATFSFNNFSISSS